MTAAGGSGSWSPKLRGTSKESLEKLRKSVKADLAANPVKVNRPSRSVVNKPYKKPAEIREEKFFRSQEAAHRKSKSRKSRKSKRL